ncbi:Hypothetical predicted protein [Mytilus galloprovincialis]|uniref:Uncharacterized protein n=1 Tax=Mytilus galloprovincialis TaxID=29158 RepID=A0A8B6HSD0_MYTGA|nr:Hypothetical predicted protein [Mytilus galloprovincialis]
MKLPQLSIPNTILLAAIGTDVVLACIVVQIKPQTRHVWWTKYKDEHQINVSDSNLHKYQGGTLQNPSLKVLDVTLNDSAEYRCYGRNTKGSNYAAMQLITGYPPVVNIKQDCYVLRVGDNVTIDVTVTNVPLGSAINWRQGRNHIYKSSRQTIGELRNPYLTIRHVELKDAGNYTLYVQNPYGNHTSFTMLKVISATIKGYEGYHKVEKAANDSLTIECVIFGETSVIWRQNGKQLKGVNQLSLKINRITRVNKGNYTCETNLETVTARSSILQLDVKDIPFVSLPHETKEVIKGSDTVLDCSYESYPKPTKVYWKKDDDIIKQSNIFKRTHNGSSVEKSVLVLHDTNQSDAGNYVCVVENSIGTGYSNILQITIKDTPSSERKEYAYEKPLIISLSVIGIILVFVGLIVCYKRRQRNNSHYESPDFKQGDVDRYSTARNADEYDLPITTDDVNTLRTSGSLDKINELKGNRAFTVNEFLQLFNDTDKFKRHIQLEFQNLTESYNTNQSGGEYYNETASFMTHKNPPEHSTYLNTALTMNENCTLFISSVPQSNSIGQFWKFVSKNGVEQIILLNKENQQVAEFYPVSDKAIEMKYLRLELDSSEKKNKNLFLFHLQLKHQVQDRKSSIPVKIYKTTNWKEKDKHLPLEVLSQLLDVTRSSKSKSALLMTK